MSLNTFENLLNREINGLLVTGIVRRDRNNLPVWSVRCTKCGSSGIGIAHDDLRNGSAKCPSSICGKPQIKQTRGTAVGASQGVRTSDIRSRLEYENSGEANKATLTRQELLREANRVYQYLYGGKKQ